MDEETRKKLEEWNKMVGNTSLGKSTPSPEDSSVQPKEDPVSDTPTPIQQDNLLRSKEHESTLKKLRTYESDAAENINQRKMSLSSMAIAEARKKEDVEEDPQKNEGGLKTALYILLSLVFIAGGIGVLGAWFYFSTEDPVIIENTFSERLLEVNQEKVQIVESQNRDDFLKEIEEIGASVRLARGEIYVPIFSKIVPPELPEDEPSTVALSSREFFELLSANAPISLYRSLDPLFVMGIWQGVERENFLVVKATFFQNAFASMLAWEPQLAEDLSFIAKPLKKVGQEDDTNSTSTETNELELFATGTNTSGALEPQINIETFDNDFRDEVLFNQDARVLRDDLGQIRLLYAFPNEETLVISGSREAFENILERLTLAKFEE